MLLEIPYNSFEIEVTTRCNAACPACARTRLNNQGLLKVRDLPAETFINMFDAYNLKDKLFFFCGTLGDAMTHPDIIEILEFLVYKDSKIDIHTNGGTRNKKFWVELAELSKLSGGNLNVRWNVDGVDTNDQYRVNVPFDKVFSNMEEYVKYGGASTWYYIEFGWNTHEILRAKEIATNLKIPFYLRKAWRNSNEGFSTMRFIPKDMVLDPDTISCKHKSRPELFIDVDGSIWPCCFIRDENGSGGVDFLYLKYGDSFNVVSEQNTLLDICNHPFYTGDLEKNGWNKDDPMFLSRCYRSCGDKGSRLAKNMELI